MQIGHGRVLRRCLQGFQPGQEGRHADAPGDPDLAARRIVAVEAEVAVRAFDADLLSDMHSVRQATGEVAECFDAERDGALVVARAGDGEGVMSLDAVEGKEGELTGAVSIPALIKPAGDFGDPVCTVYGDDCAARTPAVADAAEQRKHAGPGARSQGDAQQDADWMQPVMRRGEDDAMKDQHQVEDRHETMHVTPQMVRETPPERDEHHRQYQVERPFAHGFGGFAQCREQPVVTYFGQPSGHADQPLDERERLFEPPVCRAEQDGQDACPLVQAVDAVHSAQGSV